MSSFPEGWGKKKLPLGTTKFYLFALRRVCPLSFPTPFLERDLMLPLLPRYFHCFTFGNLDTFLFFQMSFLALLKDCNFLWNCARDFIVNGWENSFTPDLELIRQWACWAWLIDYYVRSCKKTNKMQLRMEKNLHTNGAWKNVYFDTGKKL